MAKTMSHNRCLRTQSEAVMLWEKAKELIRAAPSSGLAIEFETSVSLLFIIMDIELSSRTIAIAWYCACDDENLDWLSSRIEHEVTRIA
jgi:hypothetical protein